ncbi:unnamed protein product [Leptidea sinapis]|uniref:Nudix hydrolase domain-containing protein n=1 Tax=Leptidea sinapis TaxID=189913 RepID=A0A5E4PR82_9NEOP|nr:unnamed protein product [Leptidea sinapis]
MASPGYFSLQNIFSVAVRERCVVNLKSFKAPTSKLKHIPTKTAAVLIPICGIEKVPSILYTVRSPNLKNHSGHISFPGGKTVKNETPVETALRETEEEIGLSSSKIDVWGYGPAFPGRNNEIMITPVIGAIPKLTHMDLNVNYSEVSEVFSVPLDVLCNKDNHFHTQFKNNYILPVFVAENYKIWGITAYLTHVFLSCLLPKEIYKNEWMKKKIVLSL